MSHLIETIERLVALAAHSGGNENEKVAAAMKVCNILYEKKIGFTEGTGNYSTHRDFQPESDDALKEFYRKLVLFNGKPYEIIIRRTCRCDLCKGTLRIGDISVWIPKTSHFFHSECWSKLKIRVAR